MFDFTSLNDRNSIWISVSGGTDSALLLYLVTKYCYENCLTTKITPWVYVDGSRPGNDIDVYNIINCIQSLYPYPYEPVVVDHIYKEPGGNKVELVKPLWNRMRQSGLYDAFINALSASPPIVEMKATPNFYESFLKITTEDRTPQLKPTLSFHDNFLALTPFINIDKSDLADMYDEEGLMDNLFPLTKSCIGREVTPCFDCFWCYEKNWAFGLYDIAAPQRP